MIRRREGGEEARLSVGMEDGALVFENDRLRIGLSPTDLSITTMEMKSEFEGEFSLAGAAEMYVVLKGVTSSLPFLPFEMKEQ